MKFVLEQILKCVLLLFAVSIVVFALVSVSPIDPVQANIGQTAYTAMSPEKRAALAAYWGADTPFWDRYIQWLAGAVHGDLGTSLRFNQPVATVLLQRSANTLLLMGIAWVASGIIGFVLGVVAGAKQGTLVDKIVSAYCFVLASTPTFWLGLLALVVFSVQLGWFPLGFSAPIGKSAADVTILDVLHHVTLPAITLSVVGVANIAMHTREKTIDVMQSDFIRFAIARGATPVQALVRHGLRNIAMPAITLQFTSVAEIFGGSVLIEQVFSYPGLGQAAVTAGLGGDAPLLVGISVVSAFIVFCGNLAANVLYAVVDPRLRPSRKASKQVGEGEEASQFNLTCDPATVAKSSQRVESASGPTGAVDLQSGCGHDSPSPTVFHSPVRKLFGGRRWAAFVAIACIAALVGIFVAGLCMSTQATTTDLAIKNLAPSVAHWFGTDSLGRDMFARTFAGLSTSVGLGLAAAVVSAVIALALGIASAIGPRWVDVVVTFAIDLMLSIPHIVLLLLISYALGRGFWGVAIGIALTHWASLARVVRAEVMQVRGSAFIAHARKLGASPLQIAWRHVMPAVLPQFIVGLVLMFPHAILHEASITFLGFGLPSEAPAIGVILSESMSYLSLGMWWLAVFPGLALFACVVLFNAAGGALRRLVDPARTQL
jgi:peptide/nickel transport system permease protein